MRHRRNPKIDPLTRRIMQRDNGTIAERRSPPKLQLGMEIRLRDGRSAKLRDITADGKAVLSIGNDPAWIELPLSALA